MSKGDLLAVQVTEGRLYTGKRQQCSCGSLPYSPLVKGRMVNLQKSIKACPFSWVAADQCSSAQPDVCFGAARPACICQAGGGDTVLNDVGAEFNTSGCFCFFLICCGSPCFPLCISEKGRDGMISHLRNCRQGFIINHAWGRLVWCPALPRPRHHARGSLKSFCSLAIARSPGDEIARTASPICGPFSFT